MPMSVTMFPVLFLASRFPTHSSTYPVPRLIQTRGKGELFILIMFVIFRINTIMNRFLIEKKLGQGAFGEAFLVKSNMSGVHYVMKKLNMFSVKFLQKLPVSTSQIDR